MSRKQYLELQEKEQSLLDKLQRNPLCKKIVSKLTKIQWKLSLYEQEPLSRNNGQVLH